VPELKNLTKEKDEKIIKTTMIHKLLFFKDKLTCPLIKNIAGIITNNTNAYSLLKRANKRDKKQ
jgi:hypothetical protein